MEKADDVAGTEKCCPTLNCTINATVWFQADSQMSAFAAFARLFGFWTVCRITAPNWRHLSAALGNSDEHNFTTNSFQVHRLNDHWIIKIIGRSSVEARLQSWKWLARTQKCEFSHQIMNLTAALKINHSFVIMKKVMMHILKSEFRKNALKKWFLYFKMIINSNYSG